jgi:hypothetical protein
MHRESASGSLLAHAFARTRFNRDCAPPCIWSDCETLKTEVAANERISLACLLREAIPSEGYTHCLHRERATSSCNFLAKFLRDRRTAFRILWAKPADASQHIGSAPPPTRSLSAWHRRSGLQHSWRRPALSTRASSTRIEPAWMSSKCL